jgi:hypothetical protein
MATIDQSGDNNQASTGDNSPNIRGNRNRIGLPNKTNLGWFTSGIILPIIVGLILELIKQGRISDLFATVIGIFTK